MISWVPTKNINLTDINKKINDCVKSKHFTNNGINVIELQKYIKQIFKIDENKEVLLTCNGALGINSLIGGLNIYHKKKIRWAVQAFTFPCSNQGLLIDSIIFDLDENMGPNINDLIKKKDDYDGILITNCFGTSTNIELYENFCKSNNKLLLFDNAASSYTFYKNINHLNYGVGSMVSLHHTKPIGFGEGGFIVFDKIFLEAMQKSICFGFTQLDKYNYDIYSNNSKMSEIAAIYIRDYLKNLDFIYNHHTSLISYFIEKIKQNNWEKKIKLFTNFSDYKYSLMSTIPILFEHEVNVNLFTENNIEAKKYYYPLDINCKNSHQIFKNIVCLPLNLDITIKIIDLYIDLIQKLIK
jgi:dTDP-4-amino-4,6-dideoxygalactose transaminase